MGGGGGFLGIRGGMPRLPSFKVRKNVYNTGLSWNWDSFISSNCGQCGWEFKGKETNNHNFPLANATVVIQLYMYQIIKIINLKNTFF
jgi:hypothetical protein